MGQKLFVFTKHLTPNETLVEARTTSSFHLLDSYVFCQQMIKQCSKDFILEVRGIRASYPARQGL
jgi:hypothetical protein